VLAEPLDVLPVLYLVFVVESEEGLNAGVSRVPKLKGRPILARELFPRSHECQLRKVRPPTRRLHRVIAWCRRGPRSIRGVDHLDLRLLLSLVRRRVIKREVDHGWCRPLRRE
jgi:hypothetical protein